MGGDAKQLAQEKDGDPPKARHPGCSGKPDRARGFTQISAAPPGGASRYLDGFHTGASVLTCPTRDHDHGARVLTTRRSRAPHWGEGSQRVTVASPACEMVSDKTVRLWDTMKNGGKTLLMRMISCFQASNYSSHFPA